MGCNTCNKSTLASTTYQESTPQKSNGAVLLFGLLGIGALGYFILKKK